jgi:phosphate transport system permease protein
VDRRHIEEGVFKILMAASTAIILSTLALILATVIIKGLPALNLAMITQTPKGGYYLGKEGGILNAILGSIYLGAGATLLAVLVGVPVVLYINIYAKKGSRLVTFVRFSFDVLWGVPSIVFGAFGFAIMLFFGLRASLLGGIICVALLILPIMCRAMDEVIRMIPAELLNASYSLGATRLETALKVVTRQALPAILTAVLIAFGRGIGDAASVIFTAGFTDSIPDSLFRPAATLPLAIFFQLGTPFPEVRDRAYASAFILAALILIISIVSRVLSARFTKHVIR